MALYVNTNVSSINSQNKLNNATNSLNTTYQRLASGLRINSAKDDSAGLQISNRMTAQINGLNQGNRNANDGIALAQTAEGAMDEMTTMLQKVRTLALQSANGTNTFADRQAIQKDVKAFSEEITRISEKTTFNGQTLLSGAKGNNTLLINGKINFQVGSNANDTLNVDLSKGFSINSIINEVIPNSSIDTAITVNVAAGDTADAGNTAEVGEFINLTTGERVTLASGDAFENNVVYQRVDDPTQFLVGQTDGEAIYGEDGAALGTGGDQFTVNKDNLLSVLKGTMITEGHDEESYKVVDQIAQAAFGVGVKEPTATIDAADVQNDATLLDEMTDFKGEIILAASSYEGSQNLLKMSDALIAYVDGARADLGAIQNRMESTIRNQSNIMENTTDARSRIRDTDFAAETANLTQQSIIQQAASSMLMQANQRPQMALSLLG